MKYLHRTLALLLVGLIGMFGLLTSCNKSTGDGDATTATEVASEMACKVTLKDATGKAFPNVVLKVQKDGADVATKMTDGAGSSAMTLPTGEYTLLLTSPDGAKLYYDAEAACLTPDAPETTLTVYRGAAESWTLNAPSQKSLDNSLASCQAPLVTEGTTYVEFIKDDYTYVVFNPTRAGVFEFTADAGMHISYHGMPIMIFDEPRVLPDENGIITMPVEASAIGGDSISQMVFRISAPEGSTASGTTFTVARAGDIVMSEEEAANWITLNADKAALDALATFKEPPVGDKWATLTQGTLTNLDLKKSDLAVVLGGDGYYHLGTADGPLVFVRITSDSPYVEDFVKMCETDRLRAYFYDENGKFLRKEGYNTLFAAYGELANADGVVPLNEQLAYVIQNTGRHMGWWNYEANSDIFGDEVIPASIAWLFACAVYQ